MQLQPPATVLLPRYVRAHARRSPPPARDRAAGSQVLPDAASLARLAGAWRAAAAGNAAHRLLPMQGKSFKE
jgi:hypothetical protein